MQPENGNLPQRWAALPLIISNIRFPDLDQDAWRRSNMHEISDQFFYRVGNDADAMLLRGRAMIALLGVALGAILFLYMRSLLGVGPGLICLTLYVYSPAILANGALVTSDMSVTLFFLASTLCIWRMLHVVNWRMLLLGSLLVAGLFLSKFSAVIVLPMVVLLVIIQLASQHSTVIVFRDHTWHVHSRSLRLLVHLVTISVLAVAVWACIWAFYDFRYEIFAKTTPQINPARENVVANSTFVPWNDLLDRAHLVESCIDYMRELHFLPETYLYGFAHSWRFAQHRYAFLNGQYSDQGWRLFFPYCLLVKSQLTLFVLVGFGAGAIARRWIEAGKSWRDRFDLFIEASYRTAPLWILFIVYWGFAITSHINIGYRHILPTYPPLLMLASSSWFWITTRAPTSKQLGKSKAQKKLWMWQTVHLPKIRRSAVWRCVVALSIGLFVAESICFWPNYLAYFNQVVGGATHGYRHLIDSSLDWGQDLPALESWLANKNSDRTPFQKTYLSYFGSASPAYYGISVTLLPCFYGRTVPHIPEPLEPGTYCSATMLQNVLTTFRGEWNSDYETKYQRLASNVRLYVDSSPEGRNQLLAQTSAEFFKRMFELYEEARFARLTSFLRRREPDAEINYSILVYYLGESDLRLALEGSP
jgi:4-amino-4-deoxy-L-arabinose transferase-like glycosyltransferase